MLEPRCLIWQECDIVSPAGPWAARNQSWNWVMYRAAWRTARPLQLAGSAHDSGPFACSRSGVVCTFRSIYPYVNAQPRHGGETAMQTHGQRQSAKHKPTSRATLAISVPSSLNGRRPGTSANALGNWRWSAAAAVSRPSAATSVEALHAATSATRVCRSESQVPGQVWLTDRREGWDGSAVSGFRRCIRKRRPL
jgi:hypothetical protein